MSEGCELKRTVLHDSHVALGARMVPFAGFEMPVNYAPGILAEHLQTRRSGGLFDVSHMGRFWFRGEDAARFLQSFLTHDVSQVRVGRAQYNIIANPDGGTVDDAYLYRIGPSTYQLVANAANTDQDRAHILALLERDWQDRAVDFEDRTESLAMLALQGPQAERILRQVLAKLEAKGDLPSGRRNTLSTLTWGEAELTIARTGYTGEPVCFELFVPSSLTATLWNALLEEEAGVIQPIGLGARNTLRLEAGLPLYGDEISTRISALEAGLHNLAVRLVDTPSDFVGRESLLEQYLSESGRYLYRFIAEGRGKTPREGDRVFLGGEDLGLVTSATTVTYDLPGGEEGQTAMRRIGFVLLERTCRTGLVHGTDRRYGDSVEIRRLPEGRPEMLICSAELVREFVKVSPDGSRVEAVMYDPREPEDDLPQLYRPLAQYMVEKARTNHLWRQKECVNLIASENTPSAFVRWAEHLDPSGRYAEHQQTGNEELYYYQGIDWIKEVEERLSRELRLIFGANNLELRPISGQMANEVVFEAMVRFQSFKLRKEEPRISRMSRVFNHSLPMGGHLSSQPMGALYNYVEQDEAGKPYVTSFPVQADYPYAIDLEALEPLLFELKPNLMIFGKSMIIEPEPIREVRAMIESIHPHERPIIHFDMAHVLGLWGAGYQDPFADGADIVTGSTHKTFFGPQRGVVLTNLDETYGRRRFLGGFIRKCAFPGATSNHHLGTLQSFLAAAYEFRAFGREYQAAIHESARAFARALADCGVVVEGQASRGYTQTHQVLVDVGRGQAREVARRLEDNNIVCNFQSLPGDASFRESRGLRLGVQEMVRFGMGPAEFQELAQLMADCIRDKVPVKDQVSKLRSRHLEMKYCFSDLDLKV